MFACGRCVVCSVYANKHNHVIIQHRLSRSVVHLANLQCYATVASCRLWARYIYTQAAERECTYPLWCAHTSNVLVCEWVKWMLLYTSVVVWEAAQRSSHETSTIYLCIWRGGSPSINRKQIQTPTHAFGPCSCRRRHRRPSVSYIVSDLFWVCSWPLFSMPVYVVPLPLPLPSKFCCHGIICVRMG